MAASRLVATTIVLLVLAVGFAVEAGLRSAGYWHQLELERPALAEAPPVVDAAPSARRARRVVLVIIDGLRAREAARLPVLAALGRAGVSAVASSHYPTWSRPNYVSILSGVPPEASGVRTNHHPMRVELDTLMDRARAAGLDCALASDYEAMPRMFRRRGPDGAYRWSCASSFYAPWSGGAAENAAAIAASPAALAILHTGGVDRAGHRHGAASADYHDAALAVDRELAQVLAGLDLARDAVIVTADHGHVAGGGHGGVEPDVLGVPLVAAGAGIRRGAHALAPRLIDVAPTVAALLGVPAPGHGLGRTLVELLDLPPDALRARGAADDARLAITRAAVGAERARLHARVARLRAARGTLAFALALLIVAGGVVLVRRGVLRIDARAVAFAVLAFAAAAGAAAWLGGSSTSALPATADLAPTLAGAAGIAIALHVAASRWAARHHRDPAAQLATANAHAWLSLVLAALPAAALWAAFPAPALAVPAAAWLPRIPVTFAALACGSLGTACALAISLAIFLARAVRLAHAPVR